MVGQTSWGRGTWRFRNDDRNKSLLSSNNDEAQRFQGYYYRQIIMNWLVPFKFSLSLEIFLLNVCFFIIICFAFRHSRKVRLTHISILRLRRVKGLL